MKGRLIDKIGYNFIEGKGLLIVVVVLFSSVSFILGFFAGKKGSSSAVLLAKKTETTVLEAKMVRPAMPAPTAPPLPTAPPTQPAPVGAATVKPQEVKPQEEPPAGRKTYELVSPGEDIRHPEPVRPEQPLPEQPKPEQHKPEQPKPEHYKPEQSKPSAPPKTEPAVIPNAANLVQPKAKLPKTAKRVPDAQPQTETKTPQPTPENTKPNPPVKDVLTPVSPPPQGNQAAQGTFRASKTTVQQQKIAKEVPATNSGEKYYIQIGAFKNVSDAMRLQEDLKTKGFDTEIIKNPVNDGVTLFKVRVGSNYTKSEASQVMARLNKKGIKGFMRDNQRTP